jgi:uncharacterized protein YhbP (UPF0306 family)
MNTPTRLNSKKATASCARPPAMDAPRGRPHEMDNNLTARTAAFLDAHHVMSLATMGADGPHAANLFYARDGYALIWVSDPSSHHSRHIEERAEVAATIARDCCDFPDVQGLQIRGRAWRITHPQEEARARAGLELRYPFLRRLNEGKLCDAYHRAQLYRLEPECIVLINNQRGFGSKEVLGSEALVRLNNQLNDSRFS